MGGMIFISHAREDAAFASSLARSLEAQGHAVLVDPPLLQGDAFWRQHLARQLEGCDTMISVESPAAAASVWVQQERRGFRGTRRSVAAPPAAVSGQSPSERAAERATGRLGERPIACPAELTADSAGEGVAVTSADHSTAWAAERLALATRQQAWLHAVLARPAPRAEFDGDRAWLAGGRIVLQRVPGGTYVATEPLSNGLYREFVAAMAGQVPPPPTWTDAEFAAAFADDEQPATAMTWFEAAACAHRFGATLPGEAERAGLVAVGAASASWDWCSDRWRPDDASPLAHRVIVGTRVGVDTHDAAAADPGTPAPLRYRNAPIDRDCCVGLRPALPARAPRTSAR
jgi:hypothetical protein